MYSKPISLYSEILSNLFMGGTDDEDVIHIPARAYNRREDLPFDSIVTMYAWARPADWNVQEFRYGVPDASIKEIDLNRLRQAVDFGYDRWKQGDDVLVRCQAGLNRSGLVMALILIKDGFTAYQAIDLIRQRRTEIALFNENFVNWLLSSGANFINTDLRATA
jgi:protein-tyrosine phosphatase